MTSMVFSAPMFGYDHDRRGGKVTSIVNGVRTVGAFPFRIEAGSEKEKAKSTPRPYGGDGIHVAQHVEFATPEEKEQFLKELGYP